MTYRLAVKSACFGFLLLVFVGISASRPASADPFCYPFYPFCNDEARNTFLFADAAPFANPPSSNEPIIISSGSSVVINGMATLPLTNNEMSPQVMPLSSGTSMNSDH